MIDRRDFLKALSVGAAQVSLLGLEGCATSGAAEGPIDAPFAKVLGPVPPGVVAFCVHDKETSCLLRLVDWSGKVVASHPLPVALPHSLAQDRNDPSTIFVFELFGSAAKVDLKTGKSKVASPRGSETLFNGHGAHGLDGKVLVCTELMPKPLRTMVTIRDPSSFERIAVAPVECDGTHQVVNLPGTSIVACGNNRTSNGKAKGAITFFDYAKMQVLKQIEFPAPIVHVLPLSEGEALGISSPIEIPAGNEAMFSTDRSSAQNLMAFNSHTKRNSGPVCYASVSGNKKIYWNERRKEEMKGGFGIANLSKHQAILSTHASSGTILFWRDGRIEKSIRATSPQAVVVSSDQSRAMVHQAQTAVVYAIPSMEIVKVIPFDRQVLMMNGYTIG